MSNFSTHFSNFRCCAPKRIIQKGFTLIEIMVVVAIVAILVTLATPSWQELIVSNRNRTAVNDWIASTQFARSEALRTNGLVTVCKSANGTTCAAGTTTGFEIGWIVKTGTSAAGGVVLQDTLGKNGITMGTTLTSITFSPNGLPANNFTGASILVKDNSAGASNTAPSIRHICITRTGRARVFTDVQWLALVGNTSCASA